MNNQLQLKIMLELVWWAATAIIAAIVVYPIVSKIPNFKFLWSNVWLIVIFVTCSRYIFLLSYTWLAKLQLAKAVVFFLCIPVVMFAIDRISEYQNYFDTHDVDQILAAISYNKRTPLFNYMRTEMIFFAAGALIAALILPIRFLISIWRNRNEGTV